MKKFFPFSLIILSIFCMSQKKTKVIFFGDSITEQGAQRGGYITRVDSLSRTEHRNDQYDFIGAGVSGNKVYDLYLRLDDDVLNKKPDVVIIFIGVNDVWHKALRQTGTDPDKFEKFYQAIVNKLRAIGSKIVLCTPATIGEKTDFSNPQDGELNEYSVIIRRLAQKNRLPIIDLRKIFHEYDLKNNPENKDRGILTVDGVHLNPKGNELVAEEMWKMIKNQ